jgi:hypothetical protein
MLSLSKHERSPFDRLRANGVYVRKRDYTNELLSNILPLQIINPPVP